MQFDNATLDAFSLFGLMEKLPPWIMKEMEKYVCLLYSTGVYKGVEVVVVCTTWQRRPPAPFNSWNSNTPYRKSILYGSCLEDIH